MLGRTKAFRGVAKGLRGVAGDEGTSLSSLISDGLGEGWESCSSAMMSVGWEAGCQYRSNATLAILSAYAHSLIQVAQCSRDTADGGDRGWRMTAAAMR